MAVVFVLQASVPCADGEAVSVQASVSCADGRTVSVQASVPCADGGTVSVQEEDGGNVYQADGSSLFEPAAEWAVRSAELIQLQKFSIEMDCITEEYDDGQDYIPADEKEYDLSADYSFQTCRLLVQSNQAITDPAACASAGPFRSLYVFQYRDEKSAREAYEFYQSQEYVDFVQPDQVHTALSDAGDYSVQQIIPADSSLSFDLREYVEGMNWGISACAFPEMEGKLEEQYGDESLVPEVTVAVIDTGIDFSHELFDERISEGGYNVVRPMEMPQDDYGHGTAVSGIIALSTPDYVKILPVKVSDYDMRGGIRLTDANLYTGVERAILAGADVINMSFGGYELGSLTKKYLEDCKKAGVVVVSSYGNDSQNTENIYPACYGEVIGVSALDSDLSFASSYSNYGAGVDLAAPGSEIYTAYPMGLSAGGFAEVTGTSFSTPYVSAAAALALAYMPDASVKEIEAFLFANARDLGADRWDLYYGYGLLSFRGIGSQSPQKHYAVPLKKPKVSSAANTSSGMRIEWKEVDGAEKYYVYRKLSGGSWKKIAAVKKNVHVYTDKKAANGKTYYYRIQAYESSDNNCYSASVKRIRLKASAITGRSKTKNSFTVKYKKVSGAGGYQISYSTTKKYTKNVKNKWVKSGKTIQKKITGLKRKKTYYIRVRAYKTVGGKKYYGAWSSVKTVKLS